MSNLIHADYINIYGKPVATDARNPSWQPTKKREPKIAQSFHKGFRVDGINEEMIADAKNRREQQIAEAQSTNARPEYASRPVKCPPPFSREEYLRSGKKKPIQKRLFAIESSAKQCAELALKSGWVVAHVVEITLKAD